VSCYVRMVSSDGGVVQKIYGFVRCKLGFSNKCNIDVLGTKVMIIVLYVYHRFIKEIIEW